MAQCKHCGWQVFGDHYCSKFLRTLDPRKKEHAAHFGLPEVVPQEHSSSYKPHDSGFNTGAALGVGLATGDIGWGILAGVLFS